MKGFLMDENLPPGYSRYLGQVQPGVLVLEIGGQNAPPNGTLDQQVLDWCEANEFVLITNNRASMPVHLAEHVALGRHVPGIFTVNLNAPIPQVMQDVLTVALASQEDEYRDLITYFPL